MYKRAIEKRLHKSLFKGRIVILYGARQTGKTTLVKALMSQSSVPSLYLNCDEPDIRASLEQRTSTELKHIIGRASLVVIDEAQRIQNIGLTLKLLVDRFPDIQVVATGSSSFELANKIKEPLTGRKFEFHLYPFSLGELQKVHGEIEIQRSIARRAIFGMYPEVVLQEGEDARNILIELAGSYLYKDVLIWRDIRHSDVLDRLLCAIALQIGNEVSLQELAQTVGVDKNTISSYIEVLEQAFIVFRLMPFSRNLRNELKKMRKIYFWDTGIRNALINNLNPMDMRTDAGALWENFMIVERIKRQHNINVPISSYFWRTHQQQEVDYIEDSGGRLTAAEFKWGHGKSTRIPKSFLNAYPGSECHIVTPDNYDTFCPLTMGTPFL